jgi:quinol monooxygenase YgiN
MTGPPPAAEIAVIARYQALDDCGDQVAALLGRHAAASLAEPGCRAFVALRGIDDASSFVIYERYDSKEALEAHLASPHYLGIARDLIRPLLRDRTAEFYRILPPAAPSPP